MNKIKKALYFIFIFCLIAWALDRILVFGIRNNKIAEFGVTKNMAEGKINADVLFCGASRTLVHFDPLAIDQVITPLTSFNIGLNGKQLHLQKPYLEAYLKLNKAPQVIVQEIDLNSLENDNRALLDLGLHTFIPYREIDLSNVKGGPEYDIYRSVPLIQFSLQSNALFKGAFSGLFQYAGIIKPAPNTKGFDGRNTPWDGTFEDFVKKNPNGISYAIDTEQTKNLLDIIQMSKKNGSEIILVMAPELEEKAKYVLNREQIIKKFQEIARDNGIEFWDYSSNYKLNSDRKYFYNSSHLNRTGAEIFSKDFAADLTNHLNKKKVVAQ